MKSPFISLSDIHTAYSLSRFQPCKVICFLDAPHSVVYGNPEEPDCLLLGEGVERIVDSRDKFMSGVMFCEAIRATRLWEHMCTLPRLSARMAF